MGRSLASSVFASVPSFALRPLRSLRSLRCVRCVRCARKQSHVGSICSTSSRASAVLYDQCCVTDSRRSVVSRPQCLWTVSARLSCSRAAHNNVRSHSSVSRLEMCANRFFVQNPSHFNDSIPIPILVRNFHLIRIFPSSYSQFSPISIPIRQLNRYMDIYEEFFFCGRHACADPQPTVLDKLKTASELTIERIDSTSNIKCQRERTTAE